MTGNITITEEEVKKKTKKPSPYSLYLQGLLQSHLPYMFNYHE